MNRRDLNDLPEWWRLHTDLTAVRSDGARVIRDSAFLHSPYIVQDNRGQTLIQTGRTSLVRRPRLFRYLRSAIETVDTVWPLNPHAAAFALVADPDDWRKPIDAIIPTDRLTDVIKAIHYFTAVTEATVTVQPDGRFRVKSIGYRMGPAGP